MINSRIEELYSQALDLSADEQQELVTRLMSTLKSTRKGEKHQLSELQGLGKELWQQIDSTQYLHDLRKEWDD